MSGAGSEAHALASLPFASTSASACVYVHRLLLEVPHESVTRARGDHVGGEERVEEDALRAEDGESEPKPGLLEAHEREEVHALVLRLLEEGVDPPVVAREGAERDHVAQHGPDHSRDSGDRLQEDEPREPLLAGHRLTRSVARDAVEAGARGLDGAKRDPVADASRRAVPRGDVGDGV